MKEIFDIFPTSLLLVTSYNHPFIFVGREVVAFQSVVLRLMEYED